MAATASSNPSPSVAATLSPGPKTGSPSWNQIVRGPESESTGAPTSPNDSTERSCAENSENGGNAGGGKKPVWNKKPSNGPVENGGPVSVIIGPSEAWPALSESTKASPKLSSSESSKSLPEFGSVSSLQEIGIEASSLSTTPSVESPSQTSPAPQRSSTGNLNHNPVSNHVRPARQRSMKRDGVGNPQANGGFSHQPSVAVEGSHNHNHSSSKPTSAGGYDGSGRDNNQNHGHRESGSRNASGDHPQPRNSYRKGSGGSHSRGDGSHQNYGGRRGDQDRGNHDWNHSRSFNGRDAVMQSRPHRSFIRTPGASAPFGQPLTPARPFIAPLGVADTPMFYLGPPSIPFVVPPPPVFLYPAADTELNAKIVNQIDYYFSNENLIKDTFLRQNMDENGWVPLTLIAKFKKVMQLTENYQQILDSVRYSTVVEVQGDKIRKRDDWIRWIMPPSVQFPTASGSTSFQSSIVDKLAAQVQNVKVEEKTIDQYNSKIQLDADAAKTLISSSEDSSSPSQTVKDGESSSGN